MAGETSSWGSKSHNVRCLCVRCTGGLVDPIGPVGNNPDAKEVWDLERIVWNLIAPNRRWASNTITFGFFETAPPPSYGTEAAGFVAFNTSQRNFARQALRTWADVAGLTFVEVAAGGTGDIMFGNTDTGSASQAYAYFPSFGGTAAFQGDVWMNSTISANFDPQLGNYPYATFIHELGHALGLSHPGPYNAAPGVAITYDNNALYRQDTLMYTIMSYFWAGITGANWTNPTTGAWIHAQTPMIHDIAAMQRIYGVAGGTRVTNTTYGFNASADITGAALVGGMNPNRIYDFTINPFPVLAIWDSGGTDTLNLSGYTRANTVNLDWGSFSSVNGMVNNISIAFGANIENAIGGSGADTITGNRLANRLEGGAGADTINGGAGDDILLGGTGNDSLRGDAGFDIAVLAGLFATTTVTSVSGGRTFQATGSVDVDFVSSDVERVVFFGDTNTVLPRDFSNDFRSDAFSRTLSTISQLWTFDFSTTASGYNQSDYVDSGARLRIVSFGDFGGDGRSDVLFYSPAGNRLLISAQGPGTTGFVGIGTPQVVTSSAGLDWRVMGSGDFNADGRADIAWRNVDGSIAVWLMNGVNVQSAGIVAPLGHDWALCATADWNADDRADMIFRNVNGQIAVWTMNGLSIATGAAVGAIGQDWAFRAALDVDGDRRADLVFQNVATGELSTWRNTAGGLVSSGGIFVAGDRSIRQVGDFNGDGFGDLLIASATLGRSLLLGSAPAVGANPWTASSWTGLLFANSEVVDLLRANPVSVEPSGRYRDWSGYDGLTTINFGRASTGGAGIVILRRFDGQIDGFLHTGTTSVSTTTGLAPTRGNEWILIGQGDFDGNGSSIDLLYQRADGVVAIDAFNPGTSAWASLTGMPTLAANQRIDAVGDQNGDGISDIIVRAATGATIVYRMGASVTTATLSGPTSLAWQIEGVGDFDNDRRADIVYRNASTGEVIALFSTAGTTGVLGGNPGPNWDISGFGDFNGDGRSDILWRNLIDNSLAIWQMDGAAIAASGLLGPSPPPEWQVQGIGDMNADGRADIVWRNVNGNYALWYMNGLTISGMQNVFGYTNAWQTIGKSEFLSGGA